jgi:hypothetical protein
MRYGINEQSIVQSTTGAAARARRDSVCLQVAAIDRRVWVETHTFHQRSGGAERRR